MGILSFIANFGKKQAASSGPRPSDAVEAAAKYYPAAPRAVADKVGLFQNVRDGVPVVVAQVLLTGAKDEYWVAFNWVPGTPQSQLVQVLWDFGEAPFYNMHGFRTVLAVVDDGLVWICTSPTGVHRGVLGAMTSPAYWAV